MPSDPLSIGFDVPFDEAIAAALARGVVLPSVYYQQLQGLARQLAFSIAGITSIAQLQAVLDSLSAAMQTGQSFTEWLDEAAVMSLNLPQHRLDNIWRTNLQGNYMRGKWEQLIDNRDNRPYLQYDAVNDHRVRPSHLAMDGVIRRWDDPFWKTHSPPNGYRCVMPWTKVRGDFEIGLKSWYSGKAVEIKTESGAVLAVTANHPILTDRGWICAHQVKDGDNVLRHNFVTDSFSHGIVDNNNPPASADDVFKALSLEALGLIDISSFEFHDDANMRERDVYVAGADSVLMNGFVPLLPDSLQKRIFIGADGSGSQGVRDSGSSCATSCSSHPVLSKNPLDIRSAAFFFLHKFKRAFTNSTSLQNAALSFGIGGSNLLPRGAALALCAPRRLLDKLPFNGFGFALCSPSRAGIAQAASYNASTNTKPDRKFELTNPRAIGIRNNSLIDVYSWLMLVLGFNGIHLPSSPLSDAMVTKKAIKETPTDSFSFQHFHDRFPGQVFVDKVLSIRDFTFIGHVYDFQCKNGVIVAEDIITHNCRCSLFSLTEKQARARTGTDKEGRGTGLNKEPVNPDGSPAMPDDGWDYHPYEDQVGVLRKVLFDMKAAAGPALGAAISELISELDSLGDEPA